MPVSTPKERIKNGKKQQLYTHNAQIILDNADKKIKELSFEELKADKDGILRLPRSTMIKGNGVYNGAWHPSDEFKKAYKTFDRQPANNNHSDLIEDEVGWWEQVNYSEHRLTGIPIINLNTARGKTTYEYVRNRMLAGKPAELSVAFWCTESKETFEHDGIKYDDQLVVREIEGDHCAYVTRGACSPNDGAGIGLLSLKENKNNLDEEENMAEEEPKEEKEPEEEPEVEEKEDFKRDIYNQLKEIKEQMNKKEEPVKEENKEDPLKQKLSELENKIKNIEDSKEKPKKLSLTKDQARADFKQLSKPKQELAIKKAGIKYLANLVNSDDYRALAWKEDHPYGYKKHGLPEPKDMKNHNLYIPKEGN